MSNEELYEDDFDNEYETDPIKQLRKANKAKEKQLKEIQEELSNLLSVGCKHYFFFNTIPSPYR